MVSKLEKIFRGMIYILPGVLFFSYQPLIHFGTSESMNFEISLPLIWLVLFDVLVIWLMGQKKMLFRGFSKKWMWLLLPIWFSLSVLWSLNALRGILVVGIVWLLYLAIDGIISLRELFKKESSKVKFWKAFFWSSLLICAWCWIQCVLDLVGVPREYSLMCAGCTYSMFGFPHPDGFAIEPQFMGNLLLAPTIVAGWLMLRSRPRPADPSPRAAGANSRAAALRNAASLKHYTILFFVFTATLFLTFSRGAIYALLVATLVMMIWQIVQTKKWRWLSIGLVIVLSFLFTLNIQGIMAQVSRTDDTYFTGISKVINHLSLGVIDLEVNDSGNVGATDGSTEAVFDGYVAESTDTRLELSESAFRVWRQDFSTVMFGVGLGGAGQALYVNGLSSAPKEIVQNQYVSILLETGVVGVALCVLTLVLVVRAFWQSPLRVVLIGLLIAYGVSLLFFSGLPNALHIYLLPVVIYAIGLRKKLVS